MCPSCRVGVEVMSYGGVFPPAVPFVGSGRGNGLEDLAKSPGACV